MRLQLGCSWGGFLSTSEEDWLMVRDAEGRGTGWFKYAVAAREARRD